MNPAFALAAMDQESATDDKEDFQDVVRGSRLLVYTNVVGHLACQATRIKN